MPLAQHQSLWEVLPHRVRVDARIALVEMTAWLKDPETPCLGVYAARALREDDSGFTFLRGYEVRFSNETSAIFFKLKFG